MNPLSLRGHGYRSLGEFHIDLPQGCTGISGANGAGKSSLAGAVDLALFGARSLEPYVTEGEDTLELELVFEHAGDTYRVRRGWKRGKSALDFERLDPAYATGGLYEPLTLGTAADTQALLEQTIGLSRDTFRASAYLAQGEGAVFSEARPADRKKLLSDVLQLGIWPAAQDRVKVDRRAQEQARDTLDGRITLLDEQAGDITELEITREGAVMAVTEAEAHVAEADAAHAAASAHVRTLEQADTTWRTLGAARDTASARHQGHVRLARAADEARPHLEPLRSEIVALEQKARNLDGLQADRVRLEADVHAATVLQTERDAAEQKQETLLRRGLDLIALADRHREQAQQVLDAQGTAHCDRCQQVLGAEAAAAAHASLTADAEREADEASALAELAASIELPAVPTVDRARHDQVVVDIHAIANVPAELAAARERLAGHERTIAQTDTDEYRDTLEQLTVALRDAETALAATPPVEPAALEHVYAEAKTTFGAHQATLTAQSDARANLTRATVQLEQAEHTITELGAARDQRAAIVADVDQLDQLERAFGRDGVPAYIVEQTAIPAIEDEANRILQALGGPVARVELRTERELKTGGTADALDIVCHTETGERDYATFSGGEQTRVSLALALALAGFIGRQSCEIRMLILDEPEALDEPGMAALVGVLRDLVDRRAVESALLVSHVPALRDAFDTNILVERNANGRSELVLA